MGLKQVCLFFYQRASKKDDPFVLAQSKGQLFVSKRDGIAAPLVLGEQALLKKGFQAKRLGLKYYDPQSGLAFYDMPENKKRQVVDRVSLGRRAVDSKSLAASNLCRRASWQQVSVMFFV